MSSSMPANSSSRVNPVTPCSTPLARLRTTLFGMEVLSMNWFVQLSESHCCLTGCTCRLLAFAISSPWLPSHRCRFKQSCHQANAVLMSSADSYLVSCMHRCTPHPMFMLFCPAASKCICSHTEFCTSPRKPASTAVCVCHSRFSNCPPLSTCCSSSSCIWPCSVCICLCHSATLPLAVEASTAVSTAALALQTAPPAEHSALLLQRSDLLLLPGTARSENEMINDEREKAVMMCCRMIWLFLY